MQRDNPWFISKRKKVNFCLFGILSLVVMVAIFLFSAENSMKSSETSGEFIDLVLKLVYEDYENISPKEKANLIVNFQSLVRPMAHGSIYFVLGFMYAGAMWQLNRFSVFSKLALSWMFSFIYACSDEIHQFFVPGRAFEIKDIAVDILGALAGVLLLWCIALLFVKRNKTGVEK